MNRLILLLSLFFSFFSLQSSYGQDSGSGHTESTYLEVKEFDEEPIDNPDEIAIFGKEKTDALYYLASRIRYPENAAEKGIQGKVIIRFVVTKEGNIANAEVIQSVDPEIDNEAMRVIKSMPKWKPALKNDKAVNSYYSLPVVFKVQQ